jgi:solute carrier family 35 protein F3/4
MIDSLQVLFKKVIGDASYGQVSLFFSLIGLFNATLLWPLCLVLYFTRVETLHWDQLPWPVLLAASGLSLGISTLLLHLLLLPFFYILLCPNLVNILNHSSPLCAA